MTLKPTSFHSHSEYLWEVPLKSVH